MNRRSLAPLSAALALLVAAALFYLTFSPGPDAESGELPAKAVAASDREHGARPFAEPEKEPGYIPPVINPEDYTTAPKAHTVEGRLLKVWADRQLPDREKVERFLQMLPELSEDGKKIALDYATQLITDEDYLRQRPRLLRLANTDALREVVMLDMLTRDDAIKMPSLVELMKSPSALTKIEAREILEAYLDKDYGDDPSQWEAPVRQWVAENQDI